MTGELTLLNRQSVKRRQNKFIKQRHHIEFILTHEVVDITILCCDPLQYVNSLQSVYLSYKSLRSLLVFMSHLTTPN